MTDRKVSIVNIGYQHKDREHEQGYIYAFLSLDYMKGRPGVTVKLTQDEALQLAEKALMAVMRERATY